MEFESPDVERDFPGLYASECSSKRSNDSDFSDESFDSKLSKKDLLIGKRKDKKDRGYATLEGESSPDEEVDLKSPSKSKKSKAFKFTSSKSKDKDKDKREKSKEKEIKEIEKEKDFKKKDKELKIKTKDKKKAKDGPGDIAEEQPIFGVPLEVSTQRCPCHDGVNIPLVVRDCIDHVEMCGLHSENVYKVSGIKAKVQQMKTMYNKREPVLMNNFDLAVVTSLLKLFLRELPEPILTSELLNKFEEAASNKDISLRENDLKKLIEKVSSVNKLVLSWLLTHFNHVASQEKTNKMNIQNICSVMSPVLQMSQKLLGALLLHCESILPNVSLTKYVPPLSCTSPSLPDTFPAIKEELKKQDSLLAQLHAEMNAGFVNKLREEQLWEVQRFITQLKRKLRILEKGNSSNSIVNQTSLEETDLASSKQADSQQPVEDNEFTLNLSLQNMKIDPDLVNTGNKVSNEESATVPTQNEATPPSQNQAVALNQQSSTNVSHTPETHQTTAIIHHQPLETTLSSTSLGAVSVVSVPSVSTSPPGSLQSSHGSEIFEEDTTSTISETDLILKGLKFETGELLNLASYLQEAILDEKLKIATLQQKILSHPNYNNNIESLPTAAKFSDKGQDSASFLVRETRRLEIQKENLIRSIIEEREAIIDLKVQILMKQQDSVPIC